MQQENGAGMILAARAGVKRVGQNYDSWDFGIYLIGAVFAGLAPLGWWLVGERQVLRIVVSIRPGWARNYLSLLFRVLGASYDALARGLGLSRWTPEGFAGEALGR